MKENFVFELLKICQYYFTILFIILLKILSFSNCNLSLTNCYTPLPVRISSVPAKIFPNKIARNVPNNMSRNPPFCSFDSFSIVWLTLFINKPDIYKRLNYFHDIIHFFIWNYYCHAWSKHFLLNSCVCCWRCCC